MRMGFNASLRYLTLLWLMLIICSSFSRSISPSWNLFRSLGSWLRLNLVGGGGDDVANLWVKAHRTQNLYIYFPKRATEGKLTNLP